MHGACAPFGVVVLTPGASLQKNWRPVAAPYLRFHHANDCSVSNQVSAWSVSEKYIRNTCLKGGVEHVMREPRYLYIQSACTRFLRRPCANARPPPLLARPNAPLQVGLKKTTVLTSTGSAVGQVQLARYYLIDSQSISSASVATEPMPRFAAIVVL